MTAAYLNDRADACVRGILRPVRHEIRESQEIGASGGHSAAVGFMTSPYNRDKGLIPGSHIKYNIKLPW